MATLEYNHIVSMMKTWTNQNYHYLANQSFKQWLCNVTLPYQKIPSSTLNSQSLYQNESKGEWPEYWPWQTYLSWDKNFQIRDKQHPETGHWHENNQAWHDDRTWNNIICNFCIKVVNLICNMIPIIFSFITHSRSDKL